ncbi:LOW QUALITY PROTEIN: hypothetical protein X943_000602 [Babesia divergens]|uniref:Uncharacterized protein n=1 Tax=Babesia divergens TaxID=32595 RepID=A0AAD9GCN0_BABDI|nr:LOW QUALITY PROTEIN: hypothetical protein X943_000602 [Babesia divergens]
MKTPETEIQNDKDGKDGQGKSLKEGKNTAQQGFAGEVTRQGTEICQKKTEEDGTGTRRSNKNGSVGILFIKHSPGEHNEEERQEKDAKQN